MTKNAGSFKEGENNKRGKASRTLLLEAMERAGKTPDGFYDLLVERALNPDDTFAFSELWKRFHPIEKATAPTIEFDLPPLITTLQQILEPE